MHLLPEFIVAKIKKIQQLYVVGKVIDDRIMGFAKSHNQDSPTNIKDKDAQHEWAYGTTNVFREDDIWLKECYISPGYGFVKTIKQIDPLVAPRIWDNNPTTGFRIFGSSRRESPGNKFILIQDPRGFVFEHTIPAFATLLHETDITSGEILAPCIWNKNKTLKVIKK
jgi:hypothetical protein